MGTYNFTKFEVAERQLIQAITLFFSDGDPVSIHTLSEAGSQVLSDIGVKYGAVSILRDTRIIRKEMQKMWFKKVFESRNFFKHADRDKRDKHEFKDSFNHYSLLDGVQMHQAIKGTWIPETLAFMAWFSRKYPQVMDFDMSNIPIEDIDNMSLAYECITGMRSGEMSVDNVNLEYGLLE